MLVEERVQNPETYSFHCNYYGKEIKPVVLNQLWRNFMKQNLIDQLMQACKVTKSIAVAGAIMTRSEREKNQDKRYACGRKAYYLFPENEVPMTIFCRIQEVEGQLIYDAEGA